MPVASRRRSPATDAVARIRRRRGDVEVVLDAEERQALTAIVDTLSEALEHEASRAEEVTAAMRKTLFPMATEAISSSPT